MRTTKCKPTPEDIAEEPIRGEIYSIERLEEYAVYLAENLQIDRRLRGGRPLLQRMHENGEKLLQAYKTLSEVVSKDEILTPAAEWLVDNFHIVEDQLREIRNDLPKSYYVELPKLTVGELAGYPRVYALALALVAHTDSHLEVDAIRRFIRAFQTRSVLQIGELWAIAITLRLALIENMRRVVMGIIWDRYQGNIADRLADDIIAAAHDPARFQKILEQIPGQCGEPAELRRAFISRLSERLRDPEDEISSATEILEEYLQQSKTSTERIVALEHQRQAASQMTIANIVTSMRLISNIDWRVFFESVSKVDEILIQDPSGDYSKMDFPTRDHYRHSIERIGKRTKVDELDIARKILAMAKEQNTHIGKLLWSRGVLEVEEYFSYKLKYKEALFRFFLLFPTLSYLGVLGLLVLLACALSIWYSVQVGASLGQVVLVALFVFSPVSDLIVSVWNFFLTKVVKPQSLAKLDLSEGVPEAARTLVIIPCMLFDYKTIDDLLEKLEVHYLGNSDDQIYFSLVTDFLDSTTEFTSGDDDLVQYVLAGLKRLNEKYAPGQNLRFFLFHRRRLWNASELIWMGWERKRGKIHELNRLLRNFGATSYSVVTAPKEILGTFKYVLTLDADTQLPRDGARKLIGTALHPLNRPVYDQERGLIVGGYGIIQPRISVSLESSSQSIFALVFSGHTGIDPYTTAVSNIYQDIFGEGSFTGKGLYDIDAFEWSLRNRSPENTILSHDLFEGSFARTGLATDLELLDEYPKSYLSFFMRQHRWVRGDWQIAPWLGPFVPNAQGLFVKNHLSLISRWKIYDNLRRSLVAPGILLLFLGSWLFLPGSMFIWSGLALLAIALPCLLHVANGFFSSPRGVTWTSNFWTVLGSTRVHLAQVFLTLAFLPHQAYIQVDAIVRAGYRTIISKRQRLEWTPAAQTDLANLKAKKQKWQGSGPVYSLLLATAILLVLQGDWVRSILAVPFIVLWAFYPKIAVLTSSRLRRRVYVLSSEDKYLLQDYSRRIWHFFETFVTKEDNWLPPDNYQEDPEPVVAHRTSPTNIGLYALSVIAAKDLGYLTARGCLEKLRDSYDSLGLLERYEGHFYNWYDTQSLEPLYPKYISLVDSGNLAGYLLVVKQTSLDFQKGTLLEPSYLEGLKTTLLIVEKEINQLNQQRLATSSVASQYLLKQIKDCHNILDLSSVSSRHEWYLSLRSLRHVLDDILDSISALEYEHGARFYKNLKSWLRSILAQVGGLQQDLELYAPWSGGFLDSLRQLLAEQAPDFLPTWEELIRRLHDELIFSQMPPIFQKSIEEIEDLSKQISKDLQINKDAKAEVLDGLQKFRDYIFTAHGNIRSLLQLASQLAEQSNVFFEEMNFAFLLDKQRRVFSIGYNVVEGRHDNAFYDLLASEARLASFVAIAKGDVPQNHWFLLGRQLVPVDGHRALVSWSASMFEYVMPSLVMRTYENTLLNETLSTVVDRQIKYGKKLGVPWGVSEAGYNARDINFNYQYGPFGIPGLGLKRGLGHDLVISPYSTFLAAMVDPQKSLQNLRVMAAQKITSCYGFYEAIDYTPQRVSENQKFSIIRSFMAHHQGMSLVAIDNVLKRNLMQDRFHSEIRVRATQLLLQERVPQKVSMASPRVAEIEWAGAGESLLRAYSRDYEEVNSAVPRVQILSNGFYSLMLTATGTGYSKCEELAVSRWREDATSDTWGSFVFVTDLEKKESWSSTFQPQLKIPESYKVTFAEDKIDFRRQDGDINTHSQIIVAPEDNVEIRHIRLINESPFEKKFELTSYLEPILAVLADDSAHPSFSNLFLQTEFINSRQALLARRRPRSAQKKEIWGLHVVAVEGELVAEIQYETDRSRFIGRGRSILNPLAMDLNQELSKTVGSTLDPIFSLRVCVKIPANSSLRVQFSTGLAWSRDEALRLVDKYHDISSFERESKLAWTKSRIDLRHLGLDSEAAYLFQNLAERILYLDPSLRLPTHQLSTNTRTQANLWPYGISGDFPIVAMTINNKKDLIMIRKLLRGHEYLRLKGLIYDFVILNDSSTSYLQELQEDLQRQVRFSGSQGLLNKSGGIFILRLDAMPEPDRNLIQAMARVNISSDRGSLKDQVGRKGVSEKHPGRFVPNKQPMTDRLRNVHIPDLQFFNGLGGFSKDGKEYVILLEAAKNTPAPWINVIANAHDFGFQVSECGAGFTWSINSRENRLSAWSNDPVCDPCAETFYLRDEETGEVWTTTAAPIRDDQVYLVRHGHGYSVFEHSSNGIYQTLTQFVSQEDPVKISHLRLHNYSGRKRKISLTAYVELVLGNQREKGAPYIETEMDLESSAIFARNAYNHEFSERIAFFAMTDEMKSFTCDRKEFLGRNGHPSKPEAMKREKLGGRAGIGMDPCAALQTVFELEANSERQIVILFGQAASENEARLLVKKYRNQELVDQAYQETLVVWEQLLNKIQVKTPESSLNLMLNSWLLYQAIVCRMWARSAFYQSGGAFGFRDQLQDCMAFVYSAPEMVRAHILRAASRQFPEGDVQHWWHPPTGRGVRTHFSDDLLWLPLVVSHYIKVTEDHDILKEKISFIEAPLLSPDQEDSYTLPEVSKQSATLFEHCSRAIEKSLALGAHGLPLIGSGDWNDGMNRVGEKGQGESVWMGWFLYKVLKEFIPLCQGDAARVQKYQEHMNLLKSNIEKNAWDGSWYRRAYFDDGTPLGSESSQECKIDSLSQTWSILSGAGDPHRQIQVMAQVSEKLILRDKELILLLTPPFDKTPLDPGYIKGYVPGVRENGGQYTHAAIWVLMAFAELGEGNKVLEIFNMLNPIHHSLNRAGVHKYKIEPYVVPADVYAVEPHVGRGGWSWYTGSASWYYRSGIESILGMELRGDWLHLTPCINKTWKSFEIFYRHKTTRYHFIISNPDALEKGRCEFSGSHFEVDDSGIKLKDDGNEHKIFAKMVKL